MKKIVVGLLFVVASFAKTLVVDDNAICMFGMCTNTCEDFFIIPTGWSRYKTISDAVAHAKDGDTIKICKGHYKEQVVLTKSNITFTAGKDVTKPTDVNWYYNKDVLILGKNSGNYNKAKNTRIKNISLYQTSSNTNYHAIHGVKGDEVHLKNVVLKSDGGYAVYTENGNFRDGENSFEKVTIKSKTGGIYIGDAKKLKFKDIYITLTGTNSNYYGIRLDQNVKDNKHIFKNLSFSVKNQTAIWVTNGEGMTFEDINVNATNYNSDYRYAIVTDENVNNSKKLAFKNIKIELNKGSGFDIHKSNGVEFENITVKGSTGYGVLTRQNVHGKIKYKNIVIEAKNGYGIYVSKGKDFEIKQAKITGVDSTGYVIYLHPNVNGNHKFEDVNATTKAYGIYIDKAHNIKFKNLTLHGNSPGSGYWGIHTRQNVTGEIKIENSDINVTGIAVYCEKGTPNIKNSKIVSQQEKVLLFTTNTNIKLEKNCLYKESSSSAVYNTYINNQGKIDKIKKNCFYGSPLRSLIINASTNRTKSIDSNFWDGLSGDSYNYNKIVDNNPLSSCPNGCGGNDKNESEFICANPKEFSIVYTANEHGNIKLIGNTNICYKKNGQCQNPGRRNNNNIYAHWKDGDKNAATKNSSAAKLKLPANSEILWAGLYWQGYLAGSDVSTTNQQKTKNIKLGYTPDLNNKKVTYTTITASRLNHVYFSSSRWYYQGYADITDFVKDHGNGWYWGADIFTTLGKPTGGTLAAWSIAIVYQNKNEVFRNLTIFDGYISFAHNNDIKNALSYAQNHNCDTNNIGLAHERTITLDGFYTPKNGEVNSSLIFFAGEGDFLLKGDNLYLSDKSGLFHQISNKGNPKGNIANSSITEFGNYVDKKYLYPVYGHNTIGIDIDTFDISNIIGNSQTSTTVKMKTKDDGYFPGMFGLAIQIYQPKICYEETLYDQNGELNSSSTIQVGDTLKAHLRIRNDDNGTAEDVQITKVFDSNITQYVPNSTFIKDTDWDRLVHIGDNSSFKGVNVIFDDTNLTIKPLGYGTTSTQFRPYSNFPNEIAYIDYNFTVLTDQPFSLEYKISYIFNIGEKKFTINSTLPKCSDFNNTVSAFKPQAGSFNVVEKSFNGNSDPVAEANSPLNVLHTKIVNKNFPIKVIHLDSDNVTLSPTYGAVFLEIVDANNISDQNTCSNAPILEKIHKGIYFGSKKSLTKSQIADINFSVISKNATFRIKYINWSSVIHSKGVQCADVSNMSSNLPGIPACLDSGNKLEQVFPNNPCRDISTGEPCLPQNHGRGTKEPYNHQYGCAECLTDFSATYVCARDNFAIRPDRFEISNIPSKVVAGEKFTITFKALDFSNNPAKDYNESVNINGNSPNLEYNISKSNCKQGTLTIIDGNVFKNGETDITLKYNEVGKINLTLKEVSGSEFAKVDENDTNDLDRFITPFKTAVTVVPHHFAINANYYDFNKSSFTYISNNFNMASLLELSITAKDKDNSTTQNYNKDCYAKNIDINISHSQVPDGLSKILYSLDKNTIFTNNKTHDINFTNWTKDIFTTESNGTANLTVYINFDRNLSNPINPFKFAIQDINISDEDNVTGESSLNEDVSFYYGRVHAPDASVNKFSTNNAKVNLYYEVYDPNRSDPAGIEGNESIDDLGWYVNTAHTQTSFGKVFNIYYKNSDILSAANAPLSKATLQGYSNGTQKLIFSYDGSKEYPFRARLNINASSWLIYNQFDNNATTNSFSVLFVHSGIWHGVGDFKQTDEINSSKEEERRINW
ncbi:hypothetical protein NitYY0826_C1558 [Nitratiruptor sp. YY08-26]|uniref:right-handed parallel beta-helix repeat-containing protein n=1 Tax=unclassified Nitratiruptor TaxID=2624044 RepID=UPI0019160A29|nr:MULTISPECIES: right-handed parallel beta-helix repeat-containing protein [unclassified Nitratiruptor]BCD62675.1 hypothetical protein NitYY0813_C1556 [Nitratiruptor sp. YY08-13]BCD66611.1 hypothetical protein NitYY0826_C1558 [Nitratiruptor sp. YY08-26]